MAVTLAKSDQLWVRWFLDLKHGEAVEVTAYFDPAYKTTVYMRFSEFEKWLAEVNAAMETLREKGFPSLLERPGD